MEIRYLPHKEGDKQQTVTLEQGKQIIETELKKPESQRCLVLNQDERTIITKATMGVLTEQSHVMMFRPLAGG
jgi:hypothetical protein